MQREKREGDGDRWRWGGDREEEKEMSWEYNKGFNMYTVLIFQTCGIAADYDQVDIVSLRWVLMKSS